MLAIVPLLTALALTQSPPGAPARAADPADALLRLVPSDSAAALVVEDLAGHVDLVREHPGFRALAELPQVRGWLDSEERRSLDRSVAEIEAVAGMSWEELVRDVIGDAAVLAFQLPVEAAPPRGLLLVRPARPERLRHAIDSLNRAERAGGSLVAVDERRGPQGEYRVRRFREGRQPDAYALLPDGSFAWSNSEDLLRQVLARSSSGTSSAVPPWAAGPRSALPADALASLYLNLPALAAAPGIDDPARALMGHVLEAGAALRIRDAIELHAVERPGPDAPPGSSSPGSASRLARRLRGPVLAVAGGGFDVPAVYAALASLAPQQDPDALALVETAVAGLLGADDLRRDVLPGLGPGLLLAFQPDASSSPPATDAPPIPSLLAAVELADRPALRAGLANGMRTLMALAALDTQARAAGATFERTDRDGLPVLVFRRGPLTVAAHVGADLLVVATDPDRLAAFLAPPDAAPSALADHPALLSADQFLVVDAAALRSWLGRHRETLAVRMQKGTKDARADLELDQAIALLGLFRSAWAAQRADFDAGLWRQRVTFEWKAGAGPASTGSGR